MEFITFVAQSGPRFTTVQTVTIPESEVASLVFPEDSVHGILTTRTQGLFRVLYEDIADIFFPES